MASKIELSDALKQILDLWVAGYGDGASLEKLVQSLERNGLMDCAQRLRKEFRFYTGSCNKYICIPRALRNLLSSDDFPSGLIILKTLDITLTMEKIRENLSNCEIFSNYEELVNLVSARNDWSILVVTDESPNTLEELLVKMIGNKPFEKDMKLVFVTDEEEEKLKQIQAKHNISADHVKIIRDDMDWNDLNHSIQHEVRQRAEIYIGFRLESDSVRSALSGKPLVDLIKRRSELQLIKSTLPGPCTYYVQRYLLTRNIISEKVFKKSPGQDVFVLQGVSRLELCTMIRNKLTANSGEQLQRVSCKFISLDHLAHFSKICQLSNDPVHLLRKEADGKWRWIKSKGTIRNIQEYVSKRDVQQEVDEQELLVTMNARIFEETIPVCISDSPGMGKSFLLAQIGRKLKEIFPERIVLFVVLPELIMEVHGRGITDLKAAVKLSLAKLVSENHLGELYIESKLNADDNKIWIELLLDGFDEVDYLHCYLSNEVLKTIKSLKPVRLWITSRPHLLEALEETLCVLGYNMQPFQENNQINFLKLFWSESLGMPAENFTSSASTCLKFLKKSINSCDEDIAGIPLQCLMIAEIFQDDAKTNAGSHDAITSLETFTFIHLHDLLIKRKIELYLKRYDGITCLTQEDILDIHKWLSLQLLFPDYAGKLQQLSDKARKYSEEVLKFGLLEASSTLASPKFIHRTFAEYLIATFVAEALGCHTQTEDFMSLLYNQIFLIEPPKHKKVLEDFHFNDKSKLDNTREFLYPVVCHFLNFQIPHNNNVGLPKSKHLSYFSTIQEIISTCVRHNFTNIFKLFCDNQVVQNFAEFIFSKDLLYAAVRYANLDLITVVFF